MADTLTQLEQSGAFLGDILNWSRRNLPPIPGLNLDPLGSLGHKLSQIISAAGAPETAQDVKRFSDITSGQTNQIATDIVAAPTALYSLANMGLNWARDKTFDEVVSGQKDYGKPQLPGAAGALDFTNKVATLGSAMGKEIAGEPVELQVLKPFKTFESDPLGSAAQLTGSLARITGGILPAPPAAAAKIAALGAKINTGSKVTDAVIKGTARALEYSTPITLQPTKLGYGANLAVGGGIAAGLESIIEDEPQVRQALAQTNEESSQAFKEAKDTKDWQAVQAGMLPTTGDWKDDAKVAALIAGGTVAALLLRRGLKGASDSLKPTATLDAMVSDRLAPLRASMERLDPSASKHFDAFSARHGVDGSISTAVEHNFDTGRLPDSQVSMLGPVRPLEITPHRVVVARYNELDPSQQQAYKNLANFETEVDNRVANLLELYPNLRPYIKIYNPTTKEWVVDPVRLRALANNLGRREEEAIAVNMSGLGKGGNRVPTTTADLLRAIDTAMQDPKIAAMRAADKKDYQTLTKYIERQGLRSSNEVKLFRDTNPNYTPTDRDYGTNLWERTRKAGSGREEMGDPIQQRAQYIETVIRQAMKENVRRTWMKKFWDAKSKGDPYADKVIDRRITEVDAVVDQGNVLRTRHKNGRVNEYNKNEVVAWRDDNGKIYVDAISDPIIRAALHQESPYMTKQAMHLLDLGRRWQQLLQTGALTAVNTLFAPKSAAMTAFFGAIKKPKDVRGGPVDRFVKFLTKGQLDVPGDISNVLDIPYAIVADTLSTLSRALYQSIEHSLIKNNSAMAAIFGRNTSQLMADLFKKRWEDSIRFSMHDLGISHSAPITDHSSYVNFVQNTARRASALGATGDALMRVFKAVDQVHNIISASPISAMVRNNIKHLPPDYLAKVGREFAADPGKRALAPSAYEGVTGTSLSHALHGFKATFPYANVTVQAIADFAREFKKNPARMTVGTTIAVGLPTLFSISHNADLGPEYSDYQFNVRTAAQQAQNLYFGIPGLPPEQGVEYPIDPFYRPFQVAATTMMGAMFGLFDGSLFKPSNDHVLNRMRDIAKPRAQEAMKEAATMSIGMQLPLPAELMLAQQGYVPGEISPFKSLLRKPTEHRLAGFDEERTSRYVNDNIFGLQIDRSFDEMTRVVLGGLGDQIFDSLRTLTRTQEAGAPTSEAFQDIGEREVMRLKDGAKMFNGLLWAQSPKMSPYSIESTILFEKRQGIRKLTEASQELSRLGQSGAKTRPGGPLLGAEQMPAPDEQILAIAKEASIFNRHLDQYFMSPMKAIKDKIVSLESSAAYPPKMQRDLINEQNRLLQDYTAAALQNIEYYEKFLSERTGRKVKLDRLKLDKGIDQFELLSR